MSKQAEQNDYTELYKAILSLKNEQECADLFEDLFTIAEISAISQRLHVAKLLSQGKTCQNIASETGASTATISRVNKCLNHGANGYKMILRRLGE